MKAYSWGRIGEFGFRTLGRQEVCERPEGLPLVLTFVFSGEHFVKREGYRVDTAGELEVPLLTLAAQGLQGHQQVATCVCRENTRRPHLTAFMNHTFEPSASGCCLLLCISKGSVPVPGGLLYS